MPHGVTGSPCRFSCSPVLVPCLTRCVLFLFFEKQKMFVLNSVLKYCGPTCARTGKTLPRECESTVSRRPGHASVPSPPGTPGASRSPQPVRTRRPFYGLGVAPLPFVLGCLILLTRHMVSPVSARVEPAGHPVTHLGGPQACVDADRAAGSSAFARRVRVL